MIRAATPSDLEQIFSLYQQNSLDLNQLDNFEYKTRVQKEGFLWGNETKADLEQSLKNNPYFFVYEENTVILGFICGSSEKEYKDDEYKSWLDLAAKDIYYLNQQSYSVDKIGVAKDARHHNIGHQLLSHFQDKLKIDGYKNLFSIVRILPITNCASLLFHTKNGFKSISLAKPRTLFGVENMAGMLFFKEL